MKYSKKRQIYFVFLTGVVSAILLFFAVFCTVKGVRQGDLMKIAIVLWTWFAGFMFLMADCLTYEKVNHKPFPVSDERQLRNQGKAGIISLLILGLSWLIMSMVTMVVNESWAPSVIQAEIGILLTVTTYIAILVFTDSYDLVGKRSNYVTMAIPNMLLLVISLLSTLPYVNSFPIFENGQLTASSFNIIAGVSSGCLATVFIIKSILVKKQQNHEKSPD